MFEIIGLENILLATAFLFLALLLLFPVETWVQKLLDLKLKKTPLILIGFLPLIAVSTRFGIIGMVYLLIGLIITWAFLFAFNVDRKYIYILSLIFLGFTPFLLMADLAQLAEFFAILCYLSLVLGVIKDIFYEKIFTN